MQMKDRLSGLGAAVDHRAPAAQPLLLRHLSRHQQQMAQKGLVAGFGVGQVDQRFARNHQHVHRRLGLDVTEGQAQLIGMDLIAGNLTPQDAREDRLALGHGASAGTRQRMG